MREGKEKQYFILVDYNLIDIADDLIEALQLLMASYFMLNRTYPESCCFFLEFIQMYFFQIYPSKGTRSRLKTKTNKVHTLINILNNMKMDNAPKSKKQKVAIQK